MARGRDLLFAALKQQGIDYLFGNPGTTELPVIDGCTAHPEIKYITALHEDIAVGMAMGYARITGKVGVANLHVAPGLAHGLCNLGNAWRAGIPLLVTVGQQHTRLITQEPILVADMVTMARQFTKWSHEVRHVDELPLVLHRAFKEALTPPTGPVFLSLPADVMLAETDAVMPPITRVGARALGDADELAQTAALLARAERPLIVAGDGVGAAGAWAELAAVAEQLGAPVYTEALCSQWNFPNRHPLWAGSLPISPSGMRATFAGADVALLAGFTSQAPMALFDGAGPLIPPQVQLLYLHNNSWEIAKNFPGAAAVLGDIRLNLVQLRAGLGAALARQPGADAAVAARRDAVSAQSAARRQRWEAQVAETRDQSPIAVMQVAQSLAELLPRESVLVNEAVSNTGPFTEAIPFTDSLSFWAGKGGGLGHSMPAALGIKLGAPRRTVVNVAGDGSFLYYPQTLWTAASLNLPVLYVILNNTSYRILKQGLRAMGGPWGPAGSYPPGMDITAPAVDFVSLAQSFGMKGERVVAPADLRPALARGLAAGQPYLVEVLIERQV